MYEEGDIIWDQSSNVQKWSRTETEIKLLNARTLTIQIFWIIVMQHMVAYISTAYWNKDNKIIHVFCARNFYSILTMNRHNGRLKSLDFQFYAGEHEK